MKLDSCNLKIGQKFGCLKLVNLTTYKSGKYTRRLALLSCDCGREYSRHVSSLQAKRYVPPQSCLCKKGRESIVVSPSKPKKPPQDIIVNNKVSDYRRHAKDRGFDYNLTFEEVKSLIYQPCYYCKHPARTCRKYLNTEVYYNGIDRVDNSKGYDITNCVPACHICNKGKASNSFESFISWITRIENFSGTVSLNKVDLREANNTHLNLYKNYERKAKGRNKPFNLSYKEFYFIINQDCLYCGLPPTKEYNNSGTLTHTILHNGIDRWDNSIGYTFTNTVPCCWQCNRTKLELSLEEFLDYIQDLRANI